MFGFRLKGKHNWPLVIGAGGAAVLVYLFVASRIVKPSVPPPAPMGGNGMPHPATALSQATPITGGSAGGIPYPPGLVGYPGRGAGYLGYPSGGIVQGGYSARSFDAFPYAARIAVS